MRGLTADRHAARHAGLHGARAAARRRRGRARRTSSRSASWPTSWPPASHPFGGSDPAALLERLVSERSAAFATLEPAGARHDHPAVPARRAGGALRLGRRAARRRCARSRPGARRPGVRFRRARLVVEVPPGRGRTCSSAGHRRPADARRIPGPVRVGRLSERARPRHDHDHAAAAHVVRRAGATGDVDGRPRTGAASAATSRVLSRRSCPAAASRSRVHMTRPPRSW